MFAFLAILIYFAALSRTRLGLSLCGHSIVCVLFYSPKLQPRLNLHSQVVLVNIFDVFFYAVKLLVGCCSVVVLGGERESEIR